MQASLDGWVDNVVPEITECGLEEYIENGPIVHEEAEAASNLLDQFK